MRRLLRIRPSPSATAQRATHDAMMAVVAPAARPLPLPYLAAASNRTPCRSLWSSPARAMPAAAAPKGGAKKDGASGSGSGGQVVNEAIRTERVRLVVKDPDTGTSTTEVVSRDAALAKAKEMGLDLVLVSTASEPWVCKLLDARKEEYVRQKKERARVKASKAQVLKEIAIRGNISDHDLLIKLRRVTDFFAQGHSVRLILLPTASQMARKPQRLLELRAFILDDLLANKTKSVVEIRPPTPTHPRREFILHPKRPPATPDQPQQQSSSQQPPPPPQQQQCKAVAAEAGGSEAQ